eukprot:1194965-Prorocentrum_minimum.AAC.1
MGPDEDFLEASGGGAFSLTAVALADALRAVSGGLQIPVGASKTKQVLQERTGRLVLPTSLNSAHELSPAIKPPYLLPTPTTMHTTRRTQSLVLYFPAFL